jgi:mono/diheme cytochrome c family protein
MKKIAAGIVLIVAVVIAIVALYLMFSGPRMRVQPKLLPYQALMPPTPEGIVSVAAQPALVPPAEAMGQLRNPLPDTALTRETGQVYYGYYCAFCHGQTGHGDGPVGYSYTPAPTDLTLPRVQALSDGALYRAMLTGAGHEPVLGYVIRPQATWYIVSYLRSLQSERAEPGRILPYYLSSNALVSTIAFGAE